MDVDEFGRIMAQVMREREALNATYAELQADPGKSAREAKAAGIELTNDDLIRELVQLNLKLGNFVNMEREHADKLVRLLFDAMERLAECYEIPLPVDWPSFPEPAPRNGE
jgi:hypothetical protein